MIDPNTAVFAGLLAALSGVALVTARKTHTKYANPTAITDRRNTHENSTETVLEGSIEVIESAVPDSVPPEAVDTEKPPVLWASGIRRNVTSEGGNRSQTKRRTVESGLSVAG